MALRREESAVSDSGVGRAFGPGARRRCEATGASLAGPGDQAIGAERKPGASDGVVRGR